MSHGELDGEEPRIGTERSEERRVKRCLVYDMRRMSAALASNAHARKMGETEIAQNVGVHAFMEEELNSRAGKLARAAGKAR